MAGHQDIGGKTPVVQGERAARHRRILDEIERRCPGEEKVRRVDCVAGPETPGGGEGLRLLEDERVRAALVDVCPAETLESNRRCAFERLKEPAPLTALESSSVGALLLCSLRSRGAGCWGRVVARIFAAREIFRVAIFFG